MTPWDCVVTHHRDATSSGVGRFNRLLAERLGIPVLQLNPAGALRPERPLLSFKVTELSPTEVSLLEHMLARPGVRYDVFLHEYRGAPLEETLVREATTVLAANSGIAKAVALLPAHVEELWAPSLIVPQKPRPHGVHTVFSFGMGHKLCVDPYRRLHRLLDELGEPYAVNVSAAQHGVGHLGAAEAAQAELDELFGDRWFFLGMLSDVMISEQLRAATWFAAFFEGGARTNNTSVMTALEHGSPVITNLGADSPPELRHMVNVIDLDCAQTLPTDSATLTRLAEAGCETVAAWSWNRLIERVRGMAT